MALAASLLAFAAAPVAACAAPGPAAPGQGVWQSDPYGYVVEVGARDVTLHTLAAGHCARLDKRPRAAFESRYGTLAIAPDGATARLSGAVTRYPLRRIAALPASCARPVRDTDRLRNFDALWQAFETHHGFLAERGIDWRASRDAFRPRAAAARSDDELWTVLTAMLAPLKDGHVTLRRGNELWAVAKSPRATQADPDGVVPNGRALIESLKAWTGAADGPLRAPAIPLAQGRMIHGVTKSGSCYLAVFAMGGYAPADRAEPGVAEEEAALARALDTVATTCAGTKSTIVDLRFNPGGDDRFGMAIVERVLAAPTDVFSKSAKGPDGWTAPDMVRLTPSTAPRLAPDVAVLIGEKTISAAETTALAFRASGRAVLIGGPTQGALSDMLTKVLPNGWIVTLSNEAYRTPAGESFEARGVPPDVPVAVLAPRTAGERHGPFIAAVEAALAAR